MNTMTKLALAALAVSSFASASALADDVNRLEVRQDGHGNTSFVYRNCPLAGQSASVAVYAQGQAVGNNAVAGDSNTSPRFSVKQDSHGNQRFEYRAE